MPNLKELGPYRFLVLTDKGFWLLNANLRLKIGHFVTILTSLFMTICIKMKGHGSLQQFGVAVP